MTDGWINSLAASKFDGDENLTRDSIIKSIEKSFVEEFE